MPVASEVSVILSQDIGAAGVRICSRCIYDERVPGIHFDEEGVCNYCHQVEDFRAVYGTGTKEGKARLAKIIEEIKRRGRRKKYDCVIGVSGGTDSSYMVYLAREWGLRPLAVHYDNTWNSAIATENIRKILSKLDVDLYTHVVDNKEADDIFRSFFLAGVAELEGSTDLAYAEVLYRAAWKYGVHYVLEGHSFVTEGITPVGRNYFDGKYIRSIHKAFGRRPMRSYPLMTFARMLWWTAFLRIRKIRPFWYLEYSKEHARAFLEKEFGWRYYGGHHLENRMTAFLHAIYLPGKFDTDMRNNTLAALAREGRMTRKEAWAEYNTPPFAEDDLVNYFRKRLGISGDAYESQMNARPRNWWEYPTYKKRFEWFRPLFAILARTNLVPRSFYLKYCFPARIDHDHNR